LSIAIAHCPVSPDLVSFSSLFAKSDKLLDVAFLHPTKANRLLRLLLLRLFIALFGIFPLSMPCLTAVRS
jgi:hypothetical protein